MGKVAGVASLAAERQLKVLLRFYREGSEASIQHPLYLQIYAPARLPTPHLYLKGKHPLCHKCDTRQMDSGRCPKVLWDWYRSGRQRARAYGGQIGETPRANPLSQSTVCPGH